MPRRLLHLEGAALFFVCVYFYFALNGAWWMFVLLLLAPDLAAVGYLVNPRVGSLVYNAVHITVWPLALGSYGLLYDNPFALQIALIWAAHIGMDRMAGYGLKYPTAFKDTHLQRV